MDVSSLSRLRPGVRRRRASTWDRTGGNADAVSLAAGETVTLAEDSGAGKVTHLWFTTQCPSLYWGRELILRFYWDGRDRPAAEVPFGDFFGVGNCLTANFSSALLEAAPRHGLALHSWFPMPFSDGFRITIENQSSLPVFALYAYIDYELWPRPDDQQGRFHAWWNRRRGPGIAGPEQGTYELGTNLTSDENYVLLDTRGRGTFVGTTLNIHSVDGGWYGEGDDMIFVDSDAWPPTLHGTGTEDCFGSAWSPAETFSYPRYGQPVADRDDWAGFSALYRFHIEDPIPFEESLRATIEQGHANDRTDDWSSVAYWYDEDPVCHAPALPSVEQRLPPWPDAWRRRADEVHGFFAVAVGDPQWQTNKAALGVIAHRIFVAMHERDLGRVDELLAWIRGGSRPAVAAGSRATAQNPAQLAEATLQRWVDGFDVDAAGDARLTIGFIISDAGEWQLVVEDGICSLRPARRGHERLTMTADLATFIQFTHGQTDPWLPVLQGRLVATGDSTIALRFPALFGVATVTL